MTKSSVPKNAPPATKQDIQEIMDLLDSRFEQADSIVEEVAKLREAVEKLTGTVQVFGETLDDLRGDFEKTHADYHQRLVLQEVDWSPYCVGSSAA